MMMISSLKQILRSAFSYRQRGFSLLVAPLLAIIVGEICYLADVDWQLVKMIGVTAFMVIWWLEGTVKMGLTGLLPIVLLPCLKIANGTKVSQIYFSDSVMVCLGSLVMASAVETYELHHRAAIFLLRNARGGGLSVILGAFILLTGFTSMWLSNTATAALMVPLSRAILVQIRQHHGSVYSEMSVLNAGIAIDLSIAFAASLGGMATLTGTGSNLVLQGVMLSLFGRAGEVTFIDWFLLAAPLSVLNLFLLWLVLSICYIWLPAKQNSSSRGNSTVQSNLPNDHTEIELQSQHESKASVVYNSLRGRPGLKYISVRQSLDDNDVEMVVSKEEEVRNSENDNDKSFREDIFSQSQKLGYPEWVVIIVFVAMGLLWLTRDPPGDWGWSNRFGIEDYATDGTVAIGSCLLLMILPDKPPKWLCSTWNDQLQVQTVRAEDSNHHLAIMTQSVDRDQNETNDSIPLDTYRPIISWKAIQTLNWDIIFLLGGGFALSYGFQVSGLTEEVAELITTSGPQDLILLVFLATLIACFCTNFMSNVAAANVLLPALACVGPRYNYSPLMVLLPVALAISLAFLFPIGTPPNAIILTNKRVTIRILFQMGCLLTLVFLSSILLYCLFIVPILVPSIHEVNATIRSSC